MSISSYINKISKEIIYRVNNLGNFTDCIFIKKEGEDPYELCDMIFSSEPGTKLYDHLTVLLLECEEHESGRNPKKILFLPFDYENNNYNYYKQNKA